jgi:beta-glucosidase
MINDWSALADSLLHQMSILEKIGQMTQADKNSIKPGDITKYFIGSILSGGGQYPPSNTIQGWTEMVDGFQQEALKTRLAIPMLYGVDAVHGHAALYGATVFPHEVGLGATRDTNLARLIGQATAKELLATGIPWNFAPTVASPQDIRWGRSFESFGEEVKLVTELGTAYLQGLQVIPVEYTPATGQKIFVLATPKHFLGDGGTTFGSASQNTPLPYLLDRGDTMLDEVEVRELFLPAYKAAVDSGAKSIMASYSSLNGKKMHAHKYWITDVLKGELGFKGFIVSDWGGIAEIDGDYYKAVVTAINAGIDMHMVPYDYLRFINTMIEAINKGDISSERIDDAVHRILTVKYELGLFNHPFSDPSLAHTVGTAAHRKLARQAVRESLVLLKNENDTLPIRKNTSMIFVAGQGADDIGMQCGGWTIEWMGKTGDIQPGTTILRGICDAVSPSTLVRYNSTGDFEGMAEVGIAVIGEQPYAEGVGDKNELSISAEDIQTINRLRANCQKLVVLVLSGRPLIITSHFQVADAWVAVWLPGTEGTGVADVILGDYPFSGRLPYTWPSSNDQLPINVNNAPTASGSSAPLFPFGFGL